MTHGSQIPPGASGTSSKRRSQAPTSVPELGDDKGHSYELKHWADGEANLIRDDLERGTIASDEAIFEEETPPKKRFTRLWDKFRPPRDSDEADVQDMTITQTSEIDIQITPASGHNSKRSSRQVRRADIHRSLPPLPIHKR
jgi:hypothetical protein